MAALIRKKDVILGTPITPRTLLDTLQGYSFCISFAAGSRLNSQIDQIIDLVNSDPLGEAMLLIDNGAFTHWRKGGQMTEDYVEAFEAWASEIMGRCPRSIAVIPDVIDGTLDDNWNQIRWSCLPVERSMPVWHMHEPLSSLQAMIESGFLYIAIGSSGEYANARGEKWERRIQEAMDAIDDLCQPKSGYVRPYIHMMRAQSQHHLFPFASSDSSNVAVNHSRYKEQHGDQRARYLADRVSKRIDASGLVFFQFDFWQEAQIASGLYSNREII
jgi:hypothetical protein